MGEHLPPSTSRNTGGIFCRKEVMNVSKKEKSDAQKAKEHLQAAGYDLKKRPIRVNNQMDARLAWQAGITSVLREPKPVNSKGHP